MKKYNRASQFLDSSKPRSPVSLFFNHYLMHGAKIKQKIGNAEGFGDYFLWGKPCCLKVSLPVLLTTS